MDPEQETQDTATEETPETEDTEAAMDEAAPAWEERVQELQQEAETGHGRRPSRTERRRSRCGHSWPTRWCATARCCWHGTRTCPWRWCRARAWAELESSYERASGLVERLRRRAAEHAAQARVPAGAPARRGLDLGGLTPQQKIVQGLQQSN